VSPDGRWIVSGDRQGGLSTWLPASGDLLLAVCGHADSVTACAVTPDARFLLSAGEDRALRLWDAQTGRELAALFLPVGIDEVVAHPWQPRAACSTALGEVFVDLVGVNYGPIVVTARGRHWIVLCPACATEQNLQESDLGTVRPCDNLACALPLQVNPFVAPEGPPAIGP